MKTLMISDLTVSTELDGEAMASVAGGYSYGYIPPYWGGPSYYSHDRTDIDFTAFKADQFIGQAQTTDVATGINVAFASNLKSVVKPYQNGSNNINFS